MIAVCVKWVAGMPEPGDDRFAGTSAADQAALELALRQAEDCGDTVTVVTAGPAVAERALREALACGADRVVRIDQSLDVDSAEVARVLATYVSEAAFVWCGDCSPDRGSASVPAFLAAELGARQALGAVEVSGSTTVRVVRRLDGGRREVLDVDAPGVISVEGAAARLRRAGLGTLLAARTAVIEIRPGASLRPTPAAVRPYRPRPRDIGAPQGAHPLDRLRELTDTAAAPARGETFHLEPGEAAERIIVTLQEWGYLDSVSAHRVNVRSGR